MDSETLVMWNAQSPTPMYRIIIEGDKAYLCDYGTSRKIFRLEGNVPSGKGVVPMSTAERESKTEAAGALVYDTDLDLLYIGDGTTAGGKPVASIGVVPEEVNYGEWTR